MPIIEKHLDVGKPRDLFHRKRAASKENQKGGFRARHSASSEDDGNLAGICRIDIPDFDPH